MLEGTYDMDELVGQVRLTFSSGTIMDGPSWPLARHLRWHGDVWKTIMNNGVIVRRELWVYHEGDLVSVDGVPVGQNGRLSSAGIETALEGGVASVFGESDEEDADSDNDQGGGNSSGSGGAG